MLNIVQFHLFQSVFEERKSVEKKMLSKKDRNKLPIVLRLILNMDREGDSRIIMKMENIPEHLTSDHEVLCQTYW